MKIELKEIAITEVSNGYLNDNEEGVVGYPSKLNIRPRYQREVVYKDKSHASLTRPNTTLHKKSKKSNL